MTTPQDHLATIKRAAEAIEQHAGTIPVGLDVLMVGGHGWLGAARARLRTAEVLEETLEDYLCSHDENGYARIWNRVNKELATLAADAERDLERLDID